MIRIVLLFLIVTTYKTGAQVSVLSVADSLYLNGNYSQAITCFKQHKNREEVNHNLALAYTAIGNYDEALDHYRLAIQHNPDAALVKYQYAKLLSKTKKFDEAAMMFNDLVYIDYKNPNYHYELGLVLEKLKDSTAMNRFISAFELDSTHQKAIFKIAKFHLQKRHYKTVNKYADIGLKSYPSNVELISLKAQNYYWQQDYNKATKWFEKLIEHGESSEFIHEKLSLSYAQIYEYKKAIAQQKLNLVDNPLDATAMYVIGNYYMQLNDFENAENYIKRALKLMDNPLDNEYTRLGMILNHQKKFNEAIKMFKKALKENPENESTQFFLVRSKEAHYSDYDAKIKVYKDFILDHPKNKFITFANYRLDALKKEQSMSINENEE